MDSEFGEAFLFLTNLAWKCRITLPVLVTAVFMVMDIRLQIEINIQTGQVAADLEEDSDDGDDEIQSQDSWETVESDEPDNDNSEPNGIIQ